MYEILYSTSAWNKISIRCRWFVYIRGISASAQTHSFFTLCNHFQTLSTTNFNLKIYYTDIVPLIFHYLGTNWVELVSYHSIKQHGTEFKVG